MSMEVLLTGLYVPEGPAISDNGEILFTEQTAGRISILAGGAREDFAWVGGAPNSCALGAGEDLYICQNGGVVGSWRSTHPSVPSIQRVRDGRVVTVRTQAAGNILVSPNDLAFGPDGTLYFTDPAQPFDPDRAQANDRLFAIGSDERVIAALPGTYCNGVGVAADGTIYWVESYTRRVCTLGVDGDPVVLCQLPEGQVPDGFAIAEDGRLFIASCGSHGISVVGPQGEYLGLIELDDRANPTNCCFLDDALIVTDFGMSFETVPDSGRLWRVPVDARGSKVFRGAIH